MSKATRRLYFCFLLLICFYLTCSLLVADANAAVTASPSSANFGSVSVGSNSTATVVTLSNWTPQKITVTGVQSFVPQFSVSGSALPITVPAGHSTSFEVVFSPNSATSFSGILSFTYVRGSTQRSLSVSVAGTGVQSSYLLSASTNSLSFGNVSLGTTSTQAVTLTNTGNSSVSISQVNVTGPGFGATALVLPTSLAAGQSASLSVQFLPINSGSVTGTVSVVSNATNSPTNISLSGTGYSSAGVISANPASVNLGSVTVGSSGSQTVVLTNTGNATVNISQLTSSGAGFSASGLSVPMYLNAGQSANLNVVFAPTTAGSVTGGISVVSNASNSPASISVSGSGIAAAVAPSITTQPASQTVTAGQTATFTAAATGTAPLSYQWQKNGAAISGATSSSYTTPATTTSDSGSGFAVVLSNTAGTVTSAAATLTVNAATLLLNSSATSLDFGSVNTTSSSAQNVTFTNAGNSDVSISNVSVSGAGFDATGLSTGQTLTPGQTATLSVTFAPAASGSASGSVAVASNATNSPSTLTLTGTGVTPTSSTGTPTCGKSGDSTNYVPTDWTTFLPPGKGQSYVDPTFGCTVTRVTDASSEVWSGSFFLPLNMGYATVFPFNANDSYLMLSDGWRRYFVTDLSGNVIVPLSNMPPMNNTWVLWDATNASVFYYTYGNSLMKGSISGSTVSTSTVHQFSEYAAINFMDETDVSQDGAHVVIVGGDTSGSSPENVFVYDFVTNTKGAVYTTGCTGSVGGPNNGCLHKLIQTPDNNVIIQFAGDGSGPEQGNRLWSGVTPLPALQDATNHLDAGYDLNGNAVFIEVGNSTYTPGLTNPCPSGWGLDVRQIYNPMSAVCLLDQAPSWHVGYRGNAQQPWVGLSFFDGGPSPSPEWFDNTGNYAAPTSSNWQLYEDEIILARIDANNNSGKIYRVARAYSRSNEDFYAQPHAAISHDGRYVAFQSNMAYAHTGCPANFQSTTGCTDVYVVKVQ